MRGYDSRVGCNTGSFFARLDPALAVTSGDVTVVSTPDVVARMPSHPDWSASTLPIASDALVKRQTFERWMPELKAAGVIVPDELGDGLIVWRYDRSGVRAYVIAKRAQYVAQRRELPRSDDGRYTTISSH